ncbi:MAG: acetate kinase [Thermodesulfobacteriota bacterium]|nr:acetate kinase [Thermodesulfobacteriota bacterium]
MMKILVINSGSSSLKFQLFDSPDLTVSASGLIEQIGEEQSSARLTYFDGAGAKQMLKQSKPVAEHRQAIKVMAELLRESGAMIDVRELAGIGHRVVHGGESFHEPILIDDTVISAIEELIPLAPLHNPANLTGIRVAMDHAGDVPQVAVFDTAFHQSIPKHGYLYALPYKIYEKYHVRRYGFHGTSHSFVSKAAARFLDIPYDRFNCIVLHLGNGASACAVENGKSVDTSMGMTPLAGLVMGTRCGDIDPAITFYLERNTGMDVNRIDDMLNHESGLKGLCGSNDMRELLDAKEQGSKEMALAFEVYCYQLKKYIGAYFAALGRIDALIFTGGIGENAAPVREKACQGLGGMGITISREKNNQRKDKIMEIHEDKSAVKVLVVPTDEEREIAGQVLAVIK